MLGPDLARGVLRGMPALAHGGRILDSTVTIILTGSKMPVGVSVFILVCHLHVLVSRGSD